MRYGLGTACNTVPKIVLSAVASMNPGQSELLTMDGCFMI